MNKPVMLGLIAMLNFLCAGFNYYDNSRPIIIGLQVFTGITLTYVALKLRFKA